MMNVDLTPIFIEKSELLQLGEIRYETSEPALFERYSCASDQLENVLRTYSRSYTLLNCQGSTKIYITYDDLPEPDVDDYITDLHYPAEAYF
jgi:hypothetical protein